MDKILIFNNKLEASKYILDKELMDKKNWILPTGSTPKTLYTLMRCSNKLKSKSYKITTFNLDEYLGSHEYKNFMEDELFNHLVFKNNYIFDGKANNIDKEIENYQNLLDNTEIDVVVVGVGQNGHIAFNEPGTPINSSCRVVDLAETTITVNKTSNQKAITMGINDIMKAKKIIIMAFGKSKQDILYNVFRSKFCSKYPISYFLKNHKDCSLVVDKTAIEKLRSRLELYTNITNFNKIKNKKILIYSPHPDDDVIGLGASIYQLAKNNIVYIIYQTDGSGGGDPKIREDETKRALRILDENIISNIISLPFYKISKRIITQLDIEETKKQITLFEPNYIFSCIDWNDPKDTHWKCFHIVQEAVSELGYSNRLYGYYSAWSKIDWTYNNENLIYLFDNKVMNFKTKSILEHKSQLIPVNGDIELSYWERAIIMNSQHKYKDETHKYLEIIKKI